VLDGFSGVLNNICHWNPCSTSSQTTEASLTWLQLLSTHIAHHRTVLLVSPSREEWLSISLVSFVGIVGFFVYKMAPHTRWTLMRVVAREDFSKSRCEELVDDIKWALRKLESYGFHFPTSHFLSSIFDGSWSLPIYLVTHEAQTKFPQDQTVPPCCPSRNTKGSFLSYMLHTRNQIQGRDT
jgi:preprotein translocase subunit Sss1